ncbi:hypothetical protein D9619_007286 [Psilocybe cf. subviscida]|uniref:Uncharacterized protein n=1 Tax=Psilocybe cf. subviscida TaxID=2480587 RepID=A0A8H5B3P3_9AGAR|nr:hypothetical protein D9619_007286 [Psilocybe cf. subviscida]
MSGQSQDTEVVPMRDSRMLASQSTSLNRVSTSRSFATANTQQTKRRPSYEPLYFPKIDTDASQTRDIGYPASHDSSPRVQAIGTFVAPPTPQSVKSPSDPVYPPSINDIDVNKQVPLVAELIHTGWQQISQGIAVSGVLAAIAAQLLQYFRDDATYNGRQSSDGAKTAIIALCYATLFLNIGATILAFVITNKLGALATVAAGRSDRSAISSFDGTEAKLLENFGARTIWKYLIVEWLVTFYAGVLCLVALLLTFVWLQEPSVIGISMTILITLAIIPPTVSLVFGSGTRI